MRELERVAARGFRAVVVRPSFFHGRYPNHPVYDPVWQRLEALDVAACVVPSAGSTNPEWSCAGPFVERVAANLRIGHGIAEAVAPFTPCGRLPILTVRPALRTRREGRQRLSGPAWHRRVA